MRDDQNDDGQRVLTPVRFYICRIKASFDPIFIRLEARFVFDSIRFTHAIARFSPFFHALCISFLFATYTIARSSALLHALRVRFLFVMHLHSLPLFFCHALCALFFSYPRHRTYLCVPPFMRYSYFFYSLNTPSQTVLSLLKLCEHRTDGEGLIFGLCKSN